MKQQNLIINQTGVLAFDLVSDVLVVALLVCESQQMENRPTQAVVNALSVYEKVRHAIAGFDFKVAAFIYAQRSMAIIDADLRDERKEEFVDRVEVHYKVRDIRKDLRAQESQQPRGVYQQIEHAICGFQQPRRDDDALFVIGLKQLCVGLATQNRSQLPSQVVAILDARVHTLCTGRRMYVRRVADQKTSAVAKLIDASRVNFVG